MVGTAQNSHAKGSSRAVNIDELRKNSGLDGELGRREQRARKVYVYFVWNALLLRNA
jgi:hypothetical protein